jgi:hypothetical protein
MSIHIQNSKSAKDTAKKAKGKEQIKWKYFYIFNTVCIEIEF